MKQYIRTNDEGTAVFDYDELDQAARINLLEDARRWAGNIDVDFGNEAEATNAEKAETIEGVAYQTVSNELYWLEAAIDKDTQQMIIDTIVRELATRYNVEL